MPDPSIPELPYVDGILDEARADLTASRSFQQRLLTTQDTLLATALTIAGLFAGLAFSNHSRALSLVAVPFLLALGVVDATNWVLFRRVSHRIRSLERLLHSHVVALRELRVARPQAISELRKQVDEYQFGTERTIDAVTVKDIITYSRRRLRALLYLLIALVMLLSGILWVQPAGASTTSVCVQTDNGGIAEVSTPPVPVKGVITIVPCPA